MTCTVETGVLILNRQYLFSLLNLFYYDNSPSKPILILFNTCALGMHVFFRELSLIYIFKKELD